MDTPMLGKQSWICDPNLIEGALTPDGARDRTYLVYST
jgi:hypothetical protein